MVIESLASLLHDRSNKTRNTSPQEIVTNGTKSPRRSSGNHAFWLVVIMLLTLSVHLIALLLFTGHDPNNDQIIEYSKWALTTLLGAFGAWIGAGAAYFFGRENLVESSTSTEEALRIQRDTLQGAARLMLIRELSLTIMNKNFMFNPTENKKTVGDRLALPEYNGYWWVPVLNKEGILEDIIHARVFWSTPHPDNDPISKIIEDVDKDENLKAFRTLHGASFFVKVDINGKIADVADRMSKSGAAVGIIVDDKGKPTHCFTKQDILNAQR